MAVFTIIPVHIDLILLRRNGPKILILSGNKNVQRKVSKSYTVEPRFSVFQGTDQNYALNRSSLYCQHMSNYESTSWDLNLYTLLAELC